MNLIAKTLIASLALAGAAVAKEEPKDPTVKARVAVMQTIAQNTKTLGEMAKGTTAFDAASAEAAVAAIESAAKEIPAKFEPQATDPVSEAKPEIWTNWADFTAKAEALATAASAVDTSSLDGVKAGVGAMGGACKDCHTDYRM